MKLKFRSVFRLWMGAMLVLLCWSLWASAQTNDVSHSSVSDLEARAHFTWLSEWFSKLETEPGWQNYAFLNRVRVFGEPLWKYLASFLFVFLAFYVSKLLDFIVNAWLKRWAARTETKLDDLLIELLHGPTKFIAFVILLNLGLNIFQWPPAAEMYISKCFVLIVAFSVTYTTLKVVDLMTGLWRDRTAAGRDKSFDEQLFPIVRKSLKVFVVAVAFLATWQYLSEKPITAILASLSIGGLAVGLAAQDTLGNLFGAIAVYVDKPFRIGDRIQLDAVDGTVESIGLRSTRIRNLDGHHVTIPNKTMGNATITNVTSRTNIKTEINLGLTYDTSTEKLKRALVILDEIFRANKMTGDLLITFNRFADSSLNIQVLHWWNSTDHRPYLAGMQEFNLKIKERFEAEGIEFAFPTRTVYVRNN
ncbi:MAG: mechanosensitive ion channel family protein [Verrucomicrobiota bacterium]